MPKNIWATKKRKRNRKGKSSDSEPDAEIIERSRMPDPNDPSISIGLISDLSFSVPVKIEEEVIYPDTRFQRSTTLFPAKILEENGLPPKTHKTLKRSAERELISTIPKKRMSDPPTTTLTTSDECMIIENPKARIKVEVIDLTDDSPAIIPILCSPVRTSYQEKRVYVTENTSTTLPSICDISLKFELNEKTTEIITDVDSESENDGTVHMNSEQNKTYEGNGVINTDASCVDLLVDGLSRIQVKMEKSMPLESVNNDESSIEHPLGNYFQIKAEKFVSSKCNTEVNLENAHVAVGKNAASKTRNVILRSELNTENEAYSVAIKMKQNENFIDNDYPTSSSNFSSDSNTTEVYPVDRPIKSEQSETYKNCEKIDSQKIIYSNNENALVSSQTSIGNELNRMGISPITDYIFSGDALLHETGPFQTPLLKYLNCNMKVEALEISHALSVLINFIKNKEGKNVYESESIADSIDSQAKSEFCLVEKEKEQSDLQENEKQSFEVKGILHKISRSNFIELVDLNPSITNLDFNSTSSQFEIPIDERQLQSSLNREYLSDETRESNSPIILFESHPVRCTEIAEKRGELSEIEVNEKESLYIDEMLHKISLPNFTELVKLKSNIATLDSNSASKMESSINEGEISSPSNSDSLVDEIRQNNFPNMPFESDIKISESSNVNDSDICTIYFNTPMDIENFLEDNFPSIICMPSLDKNERSESSRNSQIEEKSRNEYFNNDLLHQTLDNATSLEKIIISSLRPSLDPVSDSNVIIDESLHHNLRQIKSPTKILVGNVNFTTDIEEKNPKCTVKNSENFSKVPSKNIFKRSHGVLFNTSNTSGDAFKTSSKRVKISEGDTYKSGSINKLGYEECMKDTHKEISPHYSQDHLGIHIGPDLLSNSPDSSLGDSNFGHNMLTTHDSCQNSILPICSETSLQNPEYRPLVNISSTKDPRIFRNYSPTLQRDVNSQKPLESFNISRTSPSQSTSEIAKLSAYPAVNQITPGSTYAMPNFPRVILSPTEVLTPTMSTMPHQRVDQMFPRMNSFQSPYHNHLTFMNNNQVFSSPVSESISFSMAQHNPQQSVQNMENQPFLSLPNFPYNSSTSQYHLMSQEILPPISRHNTLFDSYSSKDVNYGFGINPPLPVGNPPSPPPLPSTPPISEQPQSIASSTTKPLHHKRKLATTNIALPSQSSSKFFAPKSSLLPKHLKEDIGKNIIHTNNVYLIIIERNIDWIHAIDKEIGIPRMSEIGGEFKQVRSSYRNHLMYYNTYFPLLLLECFSKISTVLKASKQREKKDRNICRVVQSETKERYVSLTCDSFIRHSDVDNIPKDGHIILVKFAAIPEGNVMMLGYVCSSATRAYSHKHDHGNEILKYVNVNKLADLIKIRINFHIVFGISNINLDVPIHILKLTSIKRTLVLNEALKALRTSPLCDAILGLKKNVKSFVLPRRQDTNAMTDVVQEIVESLNPLSSQLTIVKSAPFADSFLAIVQIVEDIRKSKIPCKILVCVRSEMLCQMGMNLVQTSSNLVIINRERECVHEKLRSRVLDVKTSYIAKTLNISEDLAKSKVLQEAEVLLAVTGICFYEDVQSLARNLEFCIIHDAHSFTEPESLLPLLYGIRHLLLFGDPDESCIVNSKCGASLGYKSLFHRAYNLC